MSTTDQNQHDFRSNFGRVGNYTKGTLGGFRTFILRGNVVDLAIGIVIGAAFTSVVTSLVSNIITPLIPVPGNSLASLKWTVPYAAKQGVEVNLGAFINAVISFLIVALVIYFFVVRPVAALMARYNPPVTAAPSTRDCPYCLQTIPLKATRCSFCTSPLPPVDERTDASVVMQPGRQD